MSGEFDAWIGRVELAEDAVTPRQVRQMAATLGADAADLLPPLWHWMGWPPETPMAGLSVDGHPARGGFLPPVPLARRMWAGGRLTFHAPIAVGATMQRRSEILKVVDKTGTTGRMVFVTVGHSVHAAGALAITEEQDIVYMAMPKHFTPPPPIVAAPNPEWSAVVAMDTVRLFRFSALTFNAHRIHFDLPYAQDVEKYPGLVVHGPMQAMLLLGAAIRVRGATPQRFAFRGVRPLFHYDALALQAWPTVSGNQPLATTIENDLTCMQATVGWSA